MLGVGSEFLQGFLPNDREFDPYDIAANIVGSLGALALSTWYHTRMLDRKRQAKRYDIVPGEDLDQDLELGEGVGAQESGTVNVAPVTSRSVEEEVDNWDENIEDAWDEDEHNTGTDEGEGLKTPSASSAGEVEDHKKRAD